MQNGEIRRVLQSNLLGLCHDEAQSTQKVELLQFDPPSQMEDLCGVLALVKGVVCGRQFSLQVLVYGQGFGVGGPLVEYLDGLGAAHSFEEIGGFDAV